MNLNDAVADGIEDFESAVVVDKLVLVIFLRPCRNLDRRRKIVARRELSLKKDITRQRAG